MGQLDLFLANIRSNFSNLQLYFNTAEEAAQRFSGDQDGPIYSRFTNPNTEMFEESWPLLKTQKPVAQPLLV